MTKEYRLPHWLDTIDTIDTPRDNYKPIVYSGNSIKDTETENEKQEIKGFIKAIGQEVKLK